MWTAVSKIFPISSSFNPRREKYLNSQFLTQVDAVIDRNPDLWRAFDHKPLFLTGGTGFFGRWLLECLVRAHQRLDLHLDVTVVSRNPAGFLAKAPNIAKASFIRFVAGDIQTFPFPEPRFAYVIHGAATSARATFDGEDPLAKFDMAVNGVRRVLDFAVQCRPERMLVLGSGSVYGGLTQDIGAVAETYLGAPSTLDTGAGLGHGKRAAEFITAHYADTHNLSISIARCFSFVGACLPLDIHYAIGNFIRNALFEDCLTVQGDGSALRSYLDVGDLMIWLVTLLLHGQTKRIYNVGSDQPISIGDLATLVRDTLAPAKEVRILGTYRGGERNCYYPSIQLARTEMGLDVWTPLATAIQRTADVALTDQWQNW